MIFFAVLAVATSIVTGRQLATGRSQPRDAARIGMAIAMVVAGVTHWLNPTPFVQHLPPWVPLAEPLIYTTGVIEIGLGAALCLRQPWRHRAGWALAAYLVAVFPSNVYVAVANVDVDGQPGGWYPWARLPLQVLFVAWALWSTRDEGPFGRARPAHTSHRTHRSHAIADR
jgi:uncharacterized membrane protein